MVRNAWPRPGIRFCDQNLERARAFAVRQMIGVRARATARRGGVEGKLETEAAAHAKRAFGR